MALIGRGLKVFGKPIRRSLIMDLAPDQCNAGMFRPYYLLRDVIVSMPALGGAFLWRISPEVNFVTAFIFGIIGALGFVNLGRDMPKHAGAKAAVQG